MRRTSAGILLLAVTVLGSSARPALGQGGTENPVLFVAQVPVGGFGAGTSTFGNHVATPSSMPRGGDLVLRSPDGALRFLTQEAGYGNTGFQGASAIAVREPCVHWSGEKALFAMVVGAPTIRYQVTRQVWQIYEVSGLGAGESASIRYVDGQPAGFNNVSPIYGTDDRILFVSDRPPSGAAHHYPQLDEYESSPTVAAIYSLDETTETVTLLEHAPSGAFSLSLDSFGRVVFTKWDHLQRDQQGDAPATVAAYQAFTWASEAANAPTTTTLPGAEVFPEPRTANDPAYSPALSRHTFNHFLPWEMNQDGTAEETLNHVGRHELGGAYTDGSFVADPNLTYYVPDSLHANRLKIRGDGGLFHLREDPLVPGNFLATNAPEFGTASGGTLVRLTGAPTINPEDMVLTAVTPTGQDANVPSATGYFRNPLPMSDGSLVAVHTPATGQVTNLGSSTSPQWSYAFRLRRLALQGSFYAPAAFLTAGISRTVSWYTPDELASYSGILWELDPVEVVARPRPTARVSTVPAVEAAVFADEAVDVETFRAYLREQQLALIVGRNVTLRDRADRHQPFNLRVPGGVSSVPSSGAVYDVSHLQIFQADAVRGYGNPASPRAGRRLLARPMHSGPVSQSPGAPEGAIAIAPDGSFAALVPARRALSWQLVDPEGEGVVRERNWLSFQSGEIRVCASCHGLNRTSHGGQTEPHNEPQALRDLLVAWKVENPGGPGPSPTPSATSTPAGTPVPTPTPPPAPTPTPLACTSGIPLEGARLRTTASPFSLVLRGKAIIPKPWAGIAPNQNGVRVVIPGFLDLAIPGGAAWTVNDTGTRWRYYDPTGAVGGVQLVRIVNRSSELDGRISIYVQAAGGARVLPSPIGVGIEVVFGDADECARASFGGPLAPSPRCAGDATRLVCR